MGDREILMEKKKKDSTYGGVYTAQKTTLLLLMRRVGTWSPLMMMDVQSRHARRASGGKSSQIGNYTYLEAMAKVDQNFR